MHRGHRGLAASGESSANFQRCLDALCPFRLDPPDKDRVELDRRARERKTIIAKGSFSAYLVTAMPELPAPKEGEEDVGAVAALGPRRALASDNTAARWKSAKRKRKGAKAD